MPILFARAKPMFSGFSTRRTPGYAFLIASGVPSVLALSTTMISASAQTGQASSEARQLSRSLVTFHETMIIESFIGISENQKYSTG